MQKYNNDMYKLALDHVSEAVFMASTDGDLIYANRQFCYEYGVELGDYMGKVYHLTDTMRTKEAFDQKVQQIRDNGGELVFQSQFHHVPKGKTHTHQVTAFIVENDVWFFLKDITELVDSRDKYFELNALLDTILDNLPLCVFVKDVNDDLRYLYWNKAFARFSKIDAKDVIGKTDIEVFPDYEDAVKFRNDDMEVVHSGEPKQMIETYQSADGKMRIVQTQKIALPRDGQGPLLIGVSWDITDMQNIEQELVQERLKAEEADRQKSSFLANMSHEIRTPLNSIVGFSSLLTETEEPEQRKLYSDIIKQNSDILLQLINDILDLSKIEDNKFEFIRSPFDVWKMFANLYETHKRRTHEGVTLMLDNERPDVPVIINEDRNRVMQVLTNLITNANKFTTQGEIHFGFKIDHDILECHVSDTGIGIAPEKIDKVFERFVKLNSFAQGTGLGLPICKMLINTMGGDITLTSEVGKGSTFRFTIPYRLHIEEEEQKAAAAKEQEAEEKKLKEQRPTILIAEDVKSNYLLLQALLGKSYNLLWAQDGQEAVRLFKNEHPRMIIMDIKMPSMDGLEATRIIRNHSKDIPIVALTAYAYETDKQKAYDAGFTDYMTKPVVKAKLDEIMEKYMK